MARHAAELAIRMDDVFEELSQIVQHLQSESITDFLDADIRDLAFARVQGKNLYSFSASPSVSSTDPSLWLWSELTTRAHPIGLACVGMSR